MTGPHDALAALLTAYGRDQGALTVGGVPIGRLAARIGATPFYAYDRGLLSRRVDELRRHLPAPIHLHYAIKANPMPALVQHMAGLVDGFDVASAGEMMTALDSPMAAERISFAGPGKTRAELRRAAAADIVVNLESEAEALALAEIAGELGCRPRVLVRVNPDFELRGSGMRMGGGAKPFGVDAEEVPALLARIKDIDLAFQGFQIFTGSQNLDAASIADAQVKTLELALRLADGAPAPLRLLNIGGGFGIPYFPGDQPLDLAAVGAGLGELLARHQGALSETTVIVELGRYLVGEAGVYVCRVVDRKVSRGKTFLVTDGGLHHHLAATGNFGQVIRRNYPVVLPERLDQAGAETVTVVGCLCTPLDLLADKVSLPRAEPGDLVAIFQSGAYGRSASPSGFLSHPEAAEVLV